MYSIEILNDLQHSFYANSNDENAKWMSGYMRDQFAFFGIQSKPRREIQKPFYEEIHPLLFENKTTIIEELWSRPEREFQFFAIDLLVKYNKESHIDDIIIYETMLTNKSWWDTVDTIATKLVGTFFKKFPELRDHYFEKWLNSDNIWLNRVSIIFQLMYKSETDTNQLKRAIVKHCNSTEFFLEKAIGWALRQYAKTDETWVLEFMSSTSLRPLSIREAKKNLKK